MLSDSALERKENERRKRERERERERLWLTRCLACMSLCVCMCGIENVAQAVYRDSTQNILGILLC